jgi:surface antigen
MLRSTKARATMVIAAGVLAAAMTTAGSAAATTQRGDGAGRAVAGVPATAAQAGYGAAIRPFLDPNGYPWPNVGPTTYISDGYGYYEGECTSFAAWAVRNDGLTDSSSPNSLGNANQWHAAVTESTPHVGDVAQWDAGVNGAGGTGHVAYVSAVYGDGTIQVEEYNWLSASNNYTAHRYNTRQISASTPSRYLKF